MKASKVGCESIRSLSRLENSGDSTWTQSCVALELINMFPEASENSAMRRTAHNSN